VHRGRIGKVTKSAEENQAAFFCAKMPILKRRGKFPQHPQRHGSSGESRNALVQKRSERGEKGTVSEHKGEGVFILSQAGIANRKEGLVSRVSEETKLEMRFGKAMPTLKHPRRAAAGVLGGESTGRELFLKGKATKISEAKKPLLGWNKEERGGHFPRSGLISLDRCTLGHSARSSQISVSFSRGVLSSHFGDPRGHVGKGGTTIPPGGRGTNSNSRKKKRTLSQNKAILSQVKRGECKRPPGRSFEKDP